MIQTGEKTANRIQIINWRQHGEEESYCKIAVYPASTDCDLETEIKSGIDEDYDWDQDECPEEREDYEHTYYVNDDIVISDGEVMEHDGRKFRITITEEKD